MAHPRGLQAVPDTRRAPHMEKYVELRPVVVENEPDAHNVILKVGNQSFLLGPFACEDRAHAEWTRDMLCIALDNIVKDQAKR